MRVHHLTTARVDAGRVQGSVRPTAATTYDVDVTTYALDIPTVTMDLAWIRGRRGRLRRVAQVRRLAERVDAKAASHPG